MLWLSAGIPATLVATGWKQDITIPLLELTLSPSLILAGAIVSMSALAFVARLHARTWLALLEHTDEKDAPAHWLVSVARTHGAALVLRLLLAPSIFLATLIASMLHRPFELPLLLLLLVAPALLFEAVIAASSAALSKTGTSGQSLSLPTCMAAASLALCDLALLMIIILAVAGAAAGNAPSMVFVYILITAACALMLAATAAFPWFEREGVRRGFAATPEIVPVVKFWMRIRRT